MKNKFLATALLIAVSHGTVSAAPSAHAGFSVGANIGISHLDNKLNRQFPAALGGKDQSNFGDRKPVFGLFVGYGWAPNSSGLYLGGELFGQLEKLDAKREDNLSQGLLVLHTKLKTSSTFGLAAKAGYVCKDALFFVKLGVATTKWKFELKDDEAVVLPVNNNNKRKAGLLVGLGMDYAIARNWTIGGEYLYTAYKTLKLTSGSGADQSTMDYKPRVSTFNVRLKYTF